MTFANAGSVVALDAPVQVTQLACEPKASAIGVDGGERGFGFGAVREAYERGTARNAIGCRRVVVAEEGLARLIFLGEESGRRFELAVALVDRRAAQEGESNLRTHASIMRPMRTGTATAELRAAAHVTFPNTGLSWWSVFRINPTATCGEMTLIA